MTTYTTAKVSRTKSNVLDAAGNALVQLSHADAARWIANRLKAEADEIEFQAERRVHRLALAREYMVRRCRREMARGWQISFGF